MIVRRFDRNDTDQILSIGKEFIVESSFSFLPFSDEKMMKVLDRSLKYPDEVLCLVVEQDEKIIGSLCACLVEYFFCAERLTSDYWWYVSTEHRGSRAGFIMLKQYVAWARSHGAKEVMLSTSTGIDMEKTAEVLERAGFNRSGIQMKRRFS